MSQQPDNNINLETLLKLKRAERPDGQFWARFETELRAKQLTALLQKKPWWQPAPGVLSRLALFPVGAAAAFTIAFVSVRHYQSPASGSESAVKPAKTERQPVVLAVQQPAVEKAAPQVRDEATEPAPTVVQDRPSSDSVPALTPTEVLASVPWLNGPAQNESQAKPILDAVLANFTSARSLDLITAARSDVLSSRKSRSSAEPLTQVAPPGETRRARILAALSETRPGGMEPVAFTRTRERIASRLADEDLADDISRLGVGGDRVSFKF